MPGLPLVEGAAGLNSSVDAALQLRSPILPNLRPCLRSGRKWSLLCATPLFIDAPGRKLHLRPSSGLLLLEPRLAEQQLGPR